MIVRPHLVSVIAAVAFLQSTSGQDWPTVTAVDRQPLVASVKRLATALDSVGRPLSAEQHSTLDQIVKSTDDKKVIAEIQQLLDPLCLNAIHINAESRVKVIDSASKKQLIQNGWRTFLIKIHNEAGINPALRCSSEQAQPQYIRSDSSADPPEEITLADVKDRWLDIALPTREPMNKSLSGLALEYRLIQLYSRDVGKREATLAFDIGQGTQDLGFRNQVAILFDCEPGREVVIDVRDAKNVDDENPMMVALEFRDQQGRVYPNPARRLAPDFFFHNQIYRQRGEKLSLPEGTFDVKISRGPEYLPIEQKLIVDAKQKPVVRADLKRWIDPIDWHWYSGDHHVHAAGCAHYQNPTKGVGPDDMMRHVLGEDLKVGCVLSWGPCWYEQKKNFEGKTSLLSTPNYLMRYDVEVSGFPSSHAGHLCLLRLAEDDYPSTKTIEEWPSWTQPVLAWGKRQGGVVGYSHSGWGLTLPDYLRDGSRAKTPENQFAQASGGRAADQLPDYAMPRFDGIGANEYIVTVTQDVCDFISAVDTPAIWELNIWYHTLNCGFRCRISGETDFPCIYGDRVGLGRIYVQLDPDQKLDFDAWVDGLKDGRSYCGDGMSHVLKFEAASGDDSVRLGWRGNTDQASELALSGPGKVNFATSIAAHLDETQSDSGKDIAERRLDSKPYWHIERCRIDETRKVRAELIVNGESVQQKEIVADGSVIDIDWDVDIKESSWAAVRILPSVHTNPIFIQVDGKPVRANAKSAEWCRDAVGVCWESKKSRIRESERNAAKKSYDAAAKIYETILKESSRD